MNVIKESEIDELSVSLNGSRISWLLAGHQVELSLKNNTTASQIPGLIDVNQAVKPMKLEEIEAFLSKIVHGTWLGNNMYVMTQAPGRERNPVCLMTLSMVTTYTEMTTGSMCIAAMIKNQTAMLIIVS